MLGETVSHYRIIERLGKGGMGEVYLAEDTRLQRKVALKFLAPELARDRQAMARFRNEARAAAELSHPNIATIHDFDEVDGRPFLVIEYLEGRTLRACAMQAPLSVDDTLRVGQAIASGLTEAHAHGIVHRDIKGANVMLTTKGEVKILDFGLAHREDATQLTRPGSTLGTIGYMSPEQARGETADERSDIWGLGVVLYECLTGRLPFTGEGPAILDQIRSVDPMPPTGLRTGIPLELEQAVLRCLERDPQLRYQHADDFLAKLRAIETHTGRSGNATASRPSAGSFEQRGPLGRILAAVGLAAVLVIAGFTVWSGMGPSSSADREPSLAVVGFWDLSGGDDAVASLSITSLVQTGLVENSPCRVVSSSYLQDLRRRRLGEEEGPIERDEALEIATEANATLLLVGDLLPGAPNSSVAWQLVDTQTGESIGAQRASGTSVLELADRIIDQSLSLIVRECGMSAPDSLASVGEITTNSPEAYELYVVGLEAWRKYSLDDAILALERAIDLDPDFALAHFALAECHLSTRASMRQEAAAQHSDRAWELRETLSVKDRMRLEAYRHFVRGDNPASIAVLEECATRWPDDRSVLSDLTMRLAWAACFSRAIEVGQEALMRYPGAGDVVSVVANSQIFTGDATQAQQTIRSGLELSNDDPNLWNDLGLAQLAAGQPDSAAVSFRRSLRINPRLRFNYLDLARVEYCRGDLAEAIRMAEQNTRREGVPANQRVAALAGLENGSGLAFFYAEAGRFDDALEAFDQALALTDAPYLRMRTERQRNFLWLRAGRTEEVLRWARETQDSDVRSSRRVGLVWEGRALVALDSMDQALAVADRLEQLYDGNCGSEATAEGLRAGVAARNDPRVLIDRFSGITGWGYGAFVNAQRTADAHERLGELEEALQIHQEILRIHAGHALSHYHAARLSEQLGRSADARAAYAKFLDMWSQADEGLPEIEDARRRINGLDSRS